MPELPEVETIKSDLQALLGKKLRNFYCLKPEYLSKTRLSEKDFFPLLGQTLFQLSRQGKYLFFHLATGVLCFHLGLTGSLILTFNSSLDSNSREGSSFLLKHLILHLEFEDFGLHFFDPRRFGRVYLLKGKKELDDFLSPLGKDALAISLEELAELVIQKRIPIKALLLDQRAIAGIGNIYADEILFRTQINPKRQANTLSFSEIQRLHQVMQETLKEAIKLRGSSVKDYVDGMGRSGLFQTKHLVYQKYGKPCPRCGTILKKTIIGGRTTTFCPECQK